MSERALIVGGGPVGLALACAVQGMEAVVFESSPQRTPGDALDSRIYALSPGTRAFLRDIGAWEHLDPARVAPVRRMEIHGDRGARLSFSARPGAALAWILEAGRLAGALEEQAASLPNVAVHRPATCGAMGADATRAWVDVEGAGRFEGGLLVGADGPDSRVRAALGVEAIEHPYDEVALVANFATRDAHADTARQWFRPDGVLAWLPLPGKRISIVWSARRDRALELEGMDPATLAACVREAGGDALGPLELITPPARFPLRRIEVPAPAVAGAVLVGDAAHVVHPLAGQGVNLGLQDARQLADTLAARSALERAGDLRVLRRHVRSRREDVTAMQFVTDRLDQLFAAPGREVAWLRNAGLGLMDGQDWAKDLLATQAMR